MHTFKLAFLGFGNVGQALGRLLITKQQTLRDRYLIDWRVAGIATSRHGRAIHPEGIDLAHALELADAGKNLSPLSSQPAPEDGVDFVRACGADVLFENTPVNYQSGQPAVDHLQTALECGMHAITANKGPVVHAYPSLTALAQKQGKRFYFESAVMGGTPVFSMWREALPAAHLHEFRGILNATTNLMLTLMEGGKTFDEAVAHAQAIGIAETDPSGDTQGWDAAVKVAALTTVLMGVPLKPDQVERIGIEHLSLEDVRAAITAGRHWKLICTATRQDGSVRASVRPEQIENTDPLFHVMGTSSVITFKSDILGGLTLIEDDPGPHTTAYGLLADFINAVKTNPGA
jgi:homoserine dehydrogenase